MTRPPSYEEAEKRGLLAHQGRGIHTFSNGSHWECWASANCWECRYYDTEAIGPCAFEAASLIGIVSPSLAVLFGWTESAEYPGEFNEPDQCAFFRERTDNDGNDNPPPPEPDPLQLVLLADPTEDIAALTSEPVLMEVSA
jgi:hypothetical protein